jgi:hypothetical protein
MNPVVHPHGSARLSRPSPMARRVQAILGSAAAMALAASAPGTAQAPTRCAYSGPPSNVLTITARGDFEGVLTRSGTRLVVGDYGQPPQQCSGEVATVTNTDTIELNFAGPQLSYVEVLLENGPLAPGATLEREGAPEIELRVSGPAAAVDIVGTARRDTFRWDALGPGMGLNVNPGLAADDDVDVTVETGTHATALYVRGAGGDDTIVGGTIPARGRVHAEGGPGNDALIAPRGGIGASLSGGPGNDLITGARFDDVLLGGPGRDRIRGGGGADIITGGTGADRIWGGAGRDLLEIRDVARDIVDCGTGRDSVNTDRHDRLVGCERALRP